MATSGTIGQTQIATSTLLEHAMRRCGLSAAAQTAEVVKIAQESLFFLLLNLANRGINLWCVDKQLLGLAAGQQLYVLPPGTIDVLNAVYATPTLVAGTLTAPAGTTATLSFTSTPSAVTRYGFTPASSFTGSIQVQVSPIGGAYATVATLPSQTWVAGTSYFFDLDGVPASYGLQLVGSVAMTLSSLVAVSNSYEQKLSPFNRDDWSAQPNKQQPGRPSTNYYFEKLVNPQVTLWPVPNTTGDQLVIWRHRQVQDVGTLTQQLELPNRWLEPIIWQLALRLCFELPAPSIDPQRMQQVQLMAQQYLLDGEGNETDHAPVYLLPRVSAYTR